MILEFLLIFIFYNIFFFFLFILLFFFFKLKLFLSNYFLKLSILFSYLKIKIKYVFVISTMPMTVLTYTFILLYRIIVYYYQQDIKDLLNSLEIFIIKYENVILLIVEIIFIDFFIFLINFLLIFLFCKKKNFF